MAEMFEVVDGQPSQAVIRVIGVGGGGCNTVNQMVEAEIAGVEFICANTDRQHLERCKTSVILPLGSSVTRGLGAGSDPEKGRAAAMEDKDRIRELIDGTDMLFVTAGMGGGTGTGGAPVIAEIARELEVLTVAVVTKPFAFEGKKRMSAALKGIEEMHKHVDSLILIPNEKLQVVLGEDATMESCFKSANDVLQNAVQGISDLITRPGLVNLDFADVCTVMRARGKAMMGMGGAKGAERALQAVETALSSPLLDDLELANAHGLLVNITCDTSLKMSEINRIMSRVRDIAAEDVDVKFGTSLDLALDGELRVTVVATGLGGIKSAAVEKVIAPAVRPVPPLVVVGGGGGGSGKRDYDQPAYERTVKTAVATGTHGRGWEHQGFSPEELFDIPAFLRRQAD